jgi:hypothetical protein
MYGSHPWASSAQALRSEVKLVLASERMRVSHVRELDDLAGQLINWPSARTSDRSAVRIECNLVAVDGHRQRRGPATQDMNHEARLRDPSLAPRRIEAPFHTRNRGVWSSRCPTISGWNLVVTSITHPVLAD